MRIWPISDLHSEFGGMRLPADLPDADICVIAGDVGVGGVVPALDWLQRNVARRMKTLFVAGNHDFWRTDYVGAIREARRDGALYPDVTFLQNDSIAIDGVQFIGCTLWTDFALGGSAPLSMFEARGAMNDFRRIKFSKRPFVRFSPFQALRLHLESRSFLDQALAGHPGRAVVVTHHAPSGRSLTSDQDDVYRAAYASDLDNMMIAHGPELWIHGHIHEPADYRVGRTRVFSNPLGYPDEELRRPDWASVVVEV